MQPAWQSLDADYPVNLFWVNFREDLFIGHQELGRCFLVFQIDFHKLHPGFRSELVVCISLGQHFGQYLNFPIPSSLRTLHI